MDLSYEERRQANIKRNAQVLAQLGVVEAAPKMEPPVEPSKSRKPRNKAKVDSIDGEGDNREPTPARRSSRVRGVKLPDLSLEELERRQKLAASNQSSSMIKDDPSHRGLVDIFEYFAARKGVFPTVFVDGQFHGWVKEEYVTKFDLPASQEEQSEFEITQKSFSTRNWSSAKSRSHALFRRNPNTFFYRHKAPGEEQSMGEWSDQEYQLFLQTATRYGLGDRWGLFSSYVPGRVGYQCANYYRGNVLPKGIIYDANYMIEPATGAAIFSPHEPHPAVQKRLDALSDDKPVLILTEKESKALFAETISSSSSSVAGTPKKVKAVAEKSEDNRVSPAPSKKRRSEADLRPPSRKRARKE